MDFVSSSAAMEFCGLNKLSDVQVVLKFEEQKYDIVLGASLMTEAAGQYAHPG